MYFRILVKSCSPQRSDNIRLVHWAMALLWAILAGTRSTQLWHKIDHTFSLMDNSFYPFLHQGFEASNILYVFGSLWSRWLYGGETTQPMRRAEEYISRILCGPECSTPQPFFALIHRQSVHRRAIAWRLSHWTLVPVAAASVLRSDRLWEERHLIRTLQTQLNPPLVYALLSRVLGVDWGIARGGKDFRIPPDVIQCTSSRPFRSARLKSRLTRPCAQIRVTPRPLKQEHSVSSQLALAAAGMLQCQPAVTQELWRADRSGLFRVWQSIVRYFSGHRRTRALSTIRRICSSRTGLWELPLTRLNVVLPWLGSGSPRLLLHSALRRFMRTLLGVYDGAFPLFELKQLRIRLSWSSSPSLGSILATSAKWAKRQHWSEWPCVCAALGPHWPRARSPDGTLHVCADLSEVPWPQEHAWVAQWSCKTRLRPSASDISNSMAAALLSVAAQRRLDTIPAVRSAAAALAEEVALSTCHAWRLQDLSVAGVRDAGAAQAAAEFVQHFWVEQRDHAMQSAQVVCPALALTAIHKIWEFGAWATAKHFKYGSLHTFGFRDLPDVLDAAVDMDWLPTHLQPMRLAVRRRATLARRARSRKTPTLLVRIALCVIDRRRPRQNWTAFFAVLGYYCYVLSNAANTSTLTTRRLSSATFASLRRSRYSQTGGVLLMMTST